LDKEPAYLANNQQPSADFLITNANSQVIQGKLYSSMIAYRQENHSKVSHQGSVKEWISEQG
jgi:hypothetical protein